MFGMNGQYMQPYSNKMIVSNVKEALDRTNNYNSVMMYVIQPSGNIVEVAVDAFGNKQHREFKTIPVEAEEQVRQENNFESRLKALEEQVNKLVKGEVKDEQLKQ